MATWRVWSISVNLDALQTKKRIDRDDVRNVMSPEVRVEDVDPAVNALFRRANTPMDVEFTYETWWNWINGPDKPQHPTEKIKVLHVKKLT